MRIATCIYLFHENGSFIDSVVRFDMALQLLFAFFESMLTIVVSVDFFLFRNGREVPELQW